MPWTELPHNCPLIRCAYRCFLHVTTTNLDDNTIDQFSLNSRVYKEVEIVHIYRADEYLYIASRMDGILNTMNNLSIIYV